MKILIASIAASLLLRGVFGIAFQAMDQRVSDDQFETSSLPPSLLDPKSRLLRDAGLLQCLSLGTDEGARVDDVRELDSVTS